MIGILAGMLASVVSSARKQARQTDCKSNLRQLGAAILVYRGENEGRNPPWLSRLYPEYVDDMHVFVCRSDKNKGLDVVRPADLPPNEVDANQTFPEVIDNKSGARVPVNNLPEYQANKDIEANSYFYEFSAAESPWPAPDLDGDGSIAWWEYKENQLRVGDIANGGSPTNPKPYSQSRLPIIRCYHHHKEQFVECHLRAANGSKSTTISRGRITLNVAYAGNVWIAPLWWEGALLPGEKANP
jgi:type II secretory pathway pseudopilin PulG